MCTMSAASLPEYLPAVAAGLRSKRAAPAWCATARASSVLPLPGGPYSSTQRGVSSLTGGQQQPRARQCAGGESWIGALSPSGQHKV